MKNGIMLQAFEWELPAGGHWLRLTREARNLRKMGITAVWLPPAYKGCGGQQDVGYGVYDLYDLGEFDQKGTVSTKYGTRAEYLRCVQALKAADIQVLADVVLNHRMGADEAEDADVFADDPEDRRKAGPLRRARVFTRFTFPGRRGRYSDFLWDKTCFTGVDWDDAARQGGVFRFADKQWAPDVDMEKGNYDYLMGCDVDHRNPRVAEELRRWGVWYVGGTGIDGFRLDAVKHISAAFYRDWIKNLRETMRKELYTVGEYWHCDVGALHHWLDEVGESVNLFDVPLHCRFREASTGNGRVDMGHLFDGTLVGTRPHLAVTFVDNHDTQPGQSLESWVEGWFKATAYGLILLRSFGYPCVFWGDLYGIPSRAIGRVPELPELMRLRRRSAYGEERDYFDDASVIGFVRLGERSRPGSGLAFLCTDGAAGEKVMNVGENFAGREFVCVLGGQENVQIDERGEGKFAVGGGSCSVYVPRLTAKERLLRAAMEAREGARAALRGLWLWAKDALAPEDGHLG